MSQSHDHLQVDPEHEIARIVEMLRGELRRKPRRAGYVIGLSGGIDSSLTAALAVLATSPEQVLGVLLPERESMPESSTLALELADSLGIQTLTHDLSETLETQGVYERREEMVRSLFPEFGPDWRFRLRLPGDLREDAQLNIYQLEVHRPDGEILSKRMPLDLYRRMSAETNMKQRLRMGLLYREAESRNALVCGTTNRTETVQGFFVRYGDGGVDVEPLAHLYKTQVFALARHLDLPRAIIDRPPSPDTYSAPVTDEEFYFRLPYDLVDRVLASFERFESVEAAARDADLPLATTERIFQELKRREIATRRLRELPANLLDGALAASEAR